MSGSSNARINQKTMTASLKNLAYEMASQANANPNSRTPEIHICDRCRREEQDLMLSITDEAGRVEASELLRTLRLAWHLYGKTGCVLMCLLEEEEAENNTREGLHSSYMKHCAKGELIEFVSR